MPSEARPRAIFYIDGFNLYNGLVRRAEASGGPRATVAHKWLNLGKLAQFLAPECDVVMVRYFTSRVKRRVDDPDAGTRQQVFLRALGTVPNLSIHYGRFQRNIVSRRTAADPSRSVRVIDYKEKGSDVNIGTYLIHDALTGACETAYVVSADSDLAEPIRLSEAALTGGVIVLSPNTGDPSRRLAAVATESRRISSRALAACHFPAVMNDADGEITKPAGW